MERGSPPKSGPEPRSDYSRSSIEKDSARTEAYPRVTRCMGDLNLALGPRSDRWSHSPDLGKRFSLSPIDVFIPREILEGLYYVI
jgi:hypothetical protein